MSKQPNQKNVGNKKQSIDELHSKIPKDSRAYERAKAARALEKAKKQEEESGKKPKFVKQGVSGRNLKSKK